MILHVRPTPDIKPCPASLIALNARATASTQPTTDTCVPVCLRHAYAAPCTSTS